MLAVHSSSTSLPHATGIRADPEARLMLIFFTYCNTKEASGSPPLHRCVTIAVHLDTHKFNRKITNWLIVDGWGGVGARDGWWVVFRSSLAVVAAPVLGTTKRIKTTYRSIACPRSLSLLHSPSLYLPFPVRLKALLWNDLKCGLSKVDICGWGREGG